MASVLHGSARTTPHIRSELQEAKASFRTLARQYGVNPKTVLKWRNRTTMADAAMGPAKPRSTTLTEAEEAIVVEFRKRTLLPLDDLLGCLKDNIPKLTRSALHRCLVCNGISRLPKDPADSSKRKTFKNTAAHAAKESSLTRTRKPPLHLDGPLPTPPTSCDPVGSYFGRAALLWTF